MSRDLPFVKISATGNDFILFDFREHTLPPPDEGFLQAICRRRTGIGADGLLMLAPGEQASFRLRYFNADGRPAEMCGNGARAAAYYAFHTGLAPVQMQFEFENAILSASVTGRFVSLQMQAPRNPQKSPGILQHDAFRELGAIEVGVPHYVLLAREVDEVDVAQIGKFYREHEAFAPRGTNVNFVSEIMPGHLKIRTYERGVEEETLACGTGAVASAFLAVTQLDLQFPITLHARGGQLVVYLDEKTSQPILKGEVRIVYSGKLNRDAF